MFYKHSDGLCDSLSGQANRRDAPINLSASTLIEPLLMSCCTPQISFSRRRGGRRKVDFLRGGAYRNCTARWLGPPSVTSPVKTSRKSKCSISENIFSLANVT